MRRRMGCHQRGSCRIRDHFLMPHPPSWHCLTLLLSSICNFSNRLDGTNYNRKTLMQCRPRSNSAAGHSSGINHAAPTQHCWGKQLPLLGVGQGCSPALSSFPLHVWGQPGTAGVSLGMEGVPEDAQGGPRCRPSTPGCREAAASGGAEHPPLSPCPARLGSPAAWG